MEPFTSRADVSAIDVEDALPSSVRSVIEIRFKSITYNPMQTPKMGILPAKCRIASRLIPLSVVG